MKKTKIDTSLLPNVWLTWETTKGVFYLDCATGKKQIEMPECARKYSRSKPLINSGSKPRFAYAKYHEDIDALELAEVTIETTRKEEVKQWKYAGEKYFLKKDKTVLDENGNVKTNNFFLSHYHRSHDFKGFLGMFYRIDIPSNVVEFKKLLGAETYTVGSGRTVPVTHCWHIQEWYKTKQKVRGAGRQQKLTNKLVEIPVRDISEINEEYPADTTSSRSYWSRSGIIYFERLTDGWSVLRVLCHKYTMNGEHSDNYIEDERMYLHDDGINRIVGPSKDGWVPKRQMHTWGAYEFVNKDEASEQCNRLKYILPLLTDIGEGQMRNCLISILRFPEIEQMMRLGYNQAAKSIANSQTPKADLKFMFGDYYNDKETTILRKAGLTKHQMDKYMHVYHNNRYYENKCACALKEMRRFFGDNLIHLDNASFDRYYDGFIEINNGWERSSYSQIDTMDIDRTKFIKNVFRLGEKHKDVYRLMTDTLNAYQRLNIGTHPEINWYFENYSDVVRAHDALDDLRREQDAERRAMWNMELAERRKKEEEKRIKLDKERKKYEYEDDVYIIRLPKDSNEIIREGDRQHICIGGYTSRHALGNTNLFFLRCKSEPETPFYAIEMDSTKRIVQIHGRYNKWLGNNPEAIPTVVRWLRKNDIMCNEKILTCTSTGYSSTNSYVKMPVVD